MLQETHARCRDANQRSQDSNQRPLKCQLLSFIAQFLDGLDQIMLIEKANN